MRKCQRLSHGPRSQTQFYYCIVIFLSFGNSSENFLIECSRRNRDVGEYTYGHTDLIGQPFASPATGDLVYFVYPNKGPKDIRSATFVMPMKLQSASWYKPPQRRERVRTLATKIHSFLVQNDTRTKAVFGCVFCGKIS